MTLSFEQLAELVKSLRDTQVLSVYCDDSTDDPAARVTRHAAMRHALHHVRAALHNTAAAEVAAFDAAAARVLDYVESRPGSGVGGVAWVAFASAQALHHAERVRVHVPTVVAWDRGIRAAPYLRVQAGRMSALAVIVDHPRARVYRYVDGAVDRLIVLHAHAHLEPVTHMGDAPRQGFHPGTRGTTGTDEAERELRAGFDRMIRDVVEYVARTLRHDEWVVVGGTPQPAIHAQRALERRATGKVTLEPTLHDAATDAQILQAVEAAVVKLQATAADAAVAALVEQGAPHGRSALGLGPTLDALRERRVRDVIVTSAFVDEHPRDAEAVIASAADQAAHVEQLSDAVAGRLSSWGGVVAALRYSA